MKRLQNLSYKTLFAILFFAVAGIVFFLKIGGKTQKVSAAWWDDMWHYRKAISISNSSGSTLTNQRVKIIIDTAALVTAGKLQSDCDDIRITDINGNLLDHWDTGCNTSTTNIYFKMSSIPTTNSTIYFYYGNPSATSIEKKLGTNENPGTSCKMMKDQGSATTNGLYYVTPGGNDTDKIQVYCDQTTNDGGWTLVINNGANIIPPKPTWIDAVNNVNITGTISDNLDSFDLLLGLDYWNYIGNTAMIHMGSSPTNIIKRAHYNSFSLNTSNNYALILSGQTIDLGSDSPGFYSSHNGQQFSTYDADHDTNSGICSTYYSNTPWWYHSCWSGNIWGGGDGGGYQNKAFWTGSSSDYHNYGGILLGGTDTMKSAITSTLQPEELGTGPVAYWKFDEGSGTTVYDSVGTNNGTIYGPIYVSEDQCISEKCLSFSGSDSNNVTVLNSSALNFGTNNFTISSWVLNRNYTYPKTNFTIKKSAQCYANGASNSGFDIGHGYKTNGIDICLHDISNNYIRQTLVFDDGYQPSQLINKWTHYSFIFNRSLSKVIVYVNGIKQKNEMDTSSITGSIDNTSSLSMGNLYGWLTDGMYDEVKIYPYARTADQIKLDYNSRGSSKGSSVNLGVKSNTASSLKSSLVAHWKFDEGNGALTYDSSENNLNCTIGTGSSTPIWAQGNKNKGLSFDGNDYISTTDSTSSPLDVPNITLSAWIYPTVIDGNERMIFEKGYATGWEFSVDRSGLKVNAHHGGSYESNFMNTNNNGIIIANKWHHVVWTYDGSVTKIYVNGKVIQSLNKTGDLGVNNSNLYISSRNGNYGFFQGLIDEVKIYNRALTEEEVKQDYNQGSAVQFGSTTQNIGGTTTSLDYCIPGDPSACSGPVAEWNFEENTGTVAKDTSGNNNNGNFGAGSSAPTWTVGANNKGSGLKFDGNDYTAAAVNGTNLADYSINFWFKTNTISGTTGILQWANSISSGSPMFYVRRNNASIDIYNSGTYSSTTPINSNAWYYFSAVYSAGSTTTTIYINGIPKTTFARQQTYYNYATNLYVGNGYNGFFDGQIDGVKIYNYARTPAQIAYDYNKGAPIGWWKMDECQGSIAHDSSGNGNDGTINIGPNGNQNSLGTCVTGTSAAWTNGKDGKINASLSFDGVDDYIRTSAIPGITNNQLTISAWINPKSLSGTFEISNQDQWDGGPWTGWRLRQINTSINFKLGDNTSTTHEASGGTLIQNNWQHAVGVWDGNYIHIYLNGKEINKTAKSFTYVGNDGYHSIGKYAGSAYFYNGQIDDVRIYNYALTSEQVKNVYNGGAVNFQ